MSIFDVQHQARAHRLIQRALAGDRVPHAYIFYGPEGVGREKFADRLARIHLCDRPVQMDPGEVPDFTDWTEALLDACGACDACLLTEAQTHPDLHLIYRELIKHHPDAAVRGRKGIDLGVDVIREFVIDRVGLKPYLGKAKVFIVREAETMTNAAQDALLKTLEEPPGTTFLILIVSALEAMLPTTRSRCQLIPFGLLPTAFIDERLTSTVEDASEEQARWCAGVAAGSLGVALRHLEDGLIDHNNRLAEMLFNLPQASPTELSPAIIDQAKELGDHYRKRDKDISDTEARRRGLKSLLGLMSNWYRDVLTLSVGAAAEPVNVAHREQLNHLADSLSVHGAQQAVRAIATAERQLDLNANVQLCIDGLMIRLARIAGR